MSTPPRNGTVDGLSSAIPEPPPDAAPSGQRAPTPQEAESFAAAKTVPARYLPRPFDDELRGLASSDEGLTFNPAGIATLLELWRMVEGARTTSNDELKAERERARKLAEDKADAEVRAAVAQAALNAERASTRTRLVANSVGSVLLGLGWTAYDKAGVAGALLACTLGVALLVAAFWPRAK